MYNFINTQGESKNSCLGQEFTEEQFLEQFAALEESLALLQTQMRRMSENAKLFGSLARHIRRSACPAILSPSQGMSPCRHAQSRLPDAGFGRLSSTL
jgi:hypothetical protein